MDWAADHDHDEIDEDGGEGAWLQVNMGLTEYAGPGQADPRVEAQLLSNQSKKSNHSEQSVNPGFASQFRLV